jgi:hypothetical protein
MMRLTRSDSRLDLGTSLASADRRLLTKRTSLLKKAKKPDQNRLHTQICF